ncbi:hypothetical protein Sfulv_44320 [Streptomyces fulvorobeus]|uniref:Uncharacterized protein n=1 Tax=Streptomyces fulvorobeus TaxID=284028 RepID=A0A7J0CAT6_9ACTN|nr:hypothetical protein Sfulv_44320 [Streptomyces fulvorobeus]
MSPNSPNSPTVPFTESPLSFIAPDTCPGCFSGPESRPWTTGRRGPSAPERTGMSVPLPHRGSRSRAVTAVGTVKEYVNFCCAHATLWAPSGPRVSRGPRRRDTVASLSPT